MERARFASPWRKFSGWQTRKEGAPCSLTASGVILLVGGSQWGHFYEILAHCATHLLSVRFYGVFIGRALSLHRPLFPVERLPLCFGEREMHRDNCFFVLERMQSFISRIKINEINLAPEMEHLVMSKRKETERSAERR